MKISNVKSIWLTSQKAREEEKLANLKSNESCEESNAAKKCRRNHQ
jgi:hypothetical protein